MTYPPYPQGNVPAPPATFRLPPSGGVAITAAVLAILGGVAFLITTGLGVTAFFDPSNFHDVADVVSLVVITALSLASACLLMAGGITVIAKKRAGRASVVAGCVLALLTVVAFAVVVLTLSSASSSEADYVLGVVGMIVTAVIFGVPAVLTLILAVLPMTKEYLDFHAGDAGSGSPFLPRY